MQSPSQSDLKGQMEAMEARLQKLELEVFGTVTVPDTAPPLLVPPTPPEKPAPQPAPPPVITVPAPTPAPDQKPEPPAPTVPAKPPPVQINVGKVLNWAGIAFLVVGAALLLMFSWDMLGAWFKVGAGLAASAALVGFGERLSRRNTNQWYGQGLIAGGWSLAYFVVYAMQNIASVKVLDSVLLDCTLLITLAAGCMTHAVRKRSEVMAVLSTVLAFVTISLSPVTGFSVAAFAVLVLGVGAVAVRNQWTRVLAASTIGSYLTFTLFTQGQIAASAADPMSGLLLNAGFLLLFWLVNNAVAYLLGESNVKDEGAETAQLNPGLVSGVTLLNSLGFVGLGLWALYDAGMSGWNYLFLAGTGAAYLAATPLFARRGAALSVLTGLIGLVCVTAAVPLKLNPDATMVVWLFESALLVYAGLRFNLLSLRWFATALSALLTVKVLGEITTSGGIVINLGSLAVDWRVILGSLAAAAFGICSYLYKLPAFSAILRGYEKDFAHRAYFVAAAAVLWVLPAATASDAVRPLFWLIEGAVLLALARRSTDYLKHGATGVFFLSASASLLFLHPAVSPWLALVTVLATGAVALVYRSGTGESLAKLERVWAHRAYLLVAGAVSMAFTSQYLGFAEASTVLAVEAAALLVGALALRDRVLSTAAVLAFLPVAAATAYHASAWTWLNVLPVVAIGYGVSALAHRVFTTGGLSGSQFSGDQWTAEKDEAAMLRSVFGLAASALLAATFASLLTGPWISVAWAIQGVLLIAAGFRIDEGSFRFAGLSIFALLAGKVLFFDLSDAPTIQRILSFIVTGVAFLVGSYAYAWFRKNARPNQS